MGAGLGACGASRAGAGCGRDPCSRDRQGQTEVALRRALPVGEEAARCRPRLLSTVESKRVRQGLTPSAGTGKTVAPKDPAKAVFDPKAQSNFTEPESRILHSPNDGFIQGFSG